MTLTLTSMHESTCNVDGGVDDYVAVDVKGGVNVDVKVDVSRTIR